MNCKPNLNCRPINSIADTSQSVGGATNTLSRSGADLNPPLPKVCIEGRQWARLYTLFLIHDVIIMACVRWRSWRVYGEIAKQGCGRDNNLNRASNRDKESKHTITVCSLFLFVSLDRPPLLQLVARSGSRNTWLPIVKNKCNSVVVMIVTWCSLPSFTVFLCYRTLLRKLC